MLQKSTKSTGCLVRIGQIAVIIIVLVVLSLFASAFYQQSAAARDREAYVSSDNLVTVDGIEMHIRCEGTGSPTVVFESGAGTPYLNWWEIQEAISQNVRTCVYDRQNIGWSAYTGEMPTPNAVARTLHTLLENAGETAPYVLVGHSLGGVYVREYATLYPDDVVGMVLIDSSHEQQQTRLPQAYTTWAAGAQEPTLNVCRILAPTGILRILNMGAQSTLFAEDTPVYEEEIAIFNQSHFCAGVGADLAGIDNLNASTAPATLGDLPLVVLTADAKQADNPDAFPAEFSLEMLQQADRVWLELQEELAGLSTNSDWIVVEDAAHYIHLDQPQVVITAIRDILTQVTVR
ncbi:MAG: alpha/beta hydrolase [Anaerolineae bacterium]|nr:alpha/beta hydrolase [Anaerolineae bacterium]